LEKYGVHPPSGLTKPKLFEYFERFIQNNPVGNMKVVEEIAKAHGVEVTTLYLVEIYTLPRSYGFRHICVFSIQ
jgi:hypothetical protein